MLRARLHSAVQRFGAVVTGSLDARVSDLALAVDGLRRTFEAFPASDASVASATEAAILLSRAAQVVESQVAALIGPAIGEVLLTATEADADRLEKALSGWEVVGRRTVGAVVMVRAKLP